MCERTLPDRRKDCFIETTVSLCMSVTEYITRARLLTQNDHLFVFPALLVSSCTGCPVAKERGVHAIWMYLRSRSDSVWPGNALATCFQSSLCFCA